MHCELNSHLNSIVLQLHTPRGSKMPTKIGQAEKTSTCTAQKTSDSQSEEQDPSSVTSSLDLDLSRRRTKILDKDEIH